MLWVKRTHNINLRTVIDDFNLVLMIAGALSRSPESIKYDLFVQAASAVPHCS